MRSDLFTLVYGEQLADMDQERHIWRQTTQPMVEQVVMNRFPQASIRLLGLARDIQQLQTLQQLLDIILTVDDLLTLEHAIRRAALASQAYRRTSGKKT